MTLALPCTRTLLCFFSDGLKSCKKWNEKTIMTSCFACFNWDSSDTRPARFLILLLLVFAFFLVLGIIGVSNWRLFSADFGVLHA
jgi:hypothetical protein